MPANISHAQVRSVAAPPMLMLGGAVVAVGAYLPWMTYFGGLIPLRGTMGINGRILLTTGLLAVALGGAAAWRGSPALKQFARAAAPTLGVAITAASVWLLIGVRQLTRIHASNAMLAPRPAWGLVVVLIGGALLTLPAVRRSMRVR